MRVRAWASSAVRRALPEGTRRGVAARAVKAGTDEFRSAFAANANVGNGQSFNTFRPSLYRRLRLRILTRLGSRIPVGRGGDNFAPFRLEPSEPSKSVEVLIPVYNRIDQVRLLMSDIERERSAGRVPDAIVFHLLDDASSERSRRALRMLASAANAKLTVRETNLGFLGNVNRGYEESNADTVVLLNTDIRIPPGFFHRVLGFCGDNLDTTLITIPNFAELALRLPASATGTWREADQRLEEVGHGWFMRACTAVGYCLVIDRRVIASPLLDPSFGHGYGEDSDLHYRVLDHGHESLLYLGMCVSHEGAASYSLRPESQADYSAGQRLFWARWGGRYLGEFPVFNRALTRFLRGAFARVVVPAGLQVGFVAPGIDERVGGQQVVAAAAKTLASAGVPIRLMTTRSDQALVLDAMRTVPASEYPTLGMKGTDLLVLCGNDPIDWWYGSDQTDAPRVAVVLQGFDHLMDPRSTASFEEGIARADVVFSVSPFLDRMASVLGAHEIRAFAPGLGAASFSDDPAPWSQRSLDVLISIRADPTKGWFVGASLANHLVKEGLRVGVFGPPGLTIEHVDRSARHLGRLPRRALLSTLGSTRIFVDPVIAEGYGMMPREAILRGAHSFYGEGGGNDPGALAGHATPIQHHYDVLDIAAQIGRLLDAGSPCRSGGAECAICRLDPDVEVDPIRPELGDAILSYLRGIDA